MRISDWSSDVCSSDLLSREIERCRGMTDAPFGVNLSFLTSLNPPPYAEYVQAIIEGGVRIVETAGRNPAPYMPTLEAAGVKVRHKCTSISHPLPAARPGCADVSGGKRRWWGTRVV